MRNKVYKGLNKPLTIMGVERRLFFFALIVAFAVFNMFNTLLGGLLTFGAMYIFAINTTKNDPELLRIVLNSSKFKKRYSSMKFKPIKIVRR